MTPKPSARVCISIHALLAESDSLCPKAMSISSYFYPRSPCGERQNPKTSNLNCRNFYPRSPCGERLAGAIVTIRAGHFYPRSPCGERPSSGAATRPSGHFYPRSPCGERQTRLRNRKKWHNISIHALLAESDFWFLFFGAAYHISIHALLAESDSRLRFCWARLLAFLSTLSLRRATFDAHKTAKNSITFLSTLSLRRATPSCTTAPRPFRYFYPRSPCGERQVSKGGIRMSKNISIHALLAESDVFAVTRFKLQGEFLSTLSLRRATKDKGKVEKKRLVFLSTLSLRRATPIIDTRLYVVRFLSTLSLRRATQSYHAGATPEKFLSTLSLRRATFLIS